MDDDVELGEPLTEAELLESPLIELDTQLIVEEGARTFADDGTCKVAIIRPCVSRGKRLRGLPPIYTPQMLAENASVFGGWLMYMDHLSEAMVEAVRKRGRSIRELGGRVVSSYYDPEFVHEADAKHGYQKGAVIGRVLPQPPVRAMLEADPEILHVSINAYPKGAKSGVAPWNKSLKGMIVEGIREVPQGSVDWVPRGGAGGRVLQEDEQLAVSILESHYDAEGQMPRFNEMTVDQILEGLRSENPDAARELGLLEARRAPATPAAPAAQGGLTQADLDAALERQKTELQESFEQRLAEQRDELSEGVDETVTESRLAERNERKAHKLIAAAGLPERWTADLLRRYSITDDGTISPALLTEAAEDKTPEQVLVESVNTDIQHAQDLIAESAGTPVVTGLGGGGKKTAGQKAKNTAFRDFLRESGDDLGEKPEESIKSMVQEGIQ